MTSLLEDVVADFTLGDYMRRRRGELKITQTELALRIGKTQSDISKFESGEWRPGEEVLALLARGLEAPGKHLILARSGVDPAEEAQDVIDLPEYGREDDSQTEESIVRVPRQILENARQPECSYVITAKDSISEAHVVAGDAVVFEPLEPGETPESGALVSTLDENEGWTMFVWSVMSRRRPRGRFVGLWRTTK